VKGINDPKYQMFLKKLLKLDWKHYKLYLVGGILQGWETKDIDICVTGVVTKELPILLNKARKLGPFDMYWVKSLNKNNKHFVTKGSFAKSYDRGHPNATQRLGKWKNDGLFHMKYEPKLKNKKYTNKPLLIN
jgi:predicted nucleotidyltransferase